MRYFYQFLSVLNASLMVSSFKWTLNENIAKNLVLRCTEGYMFANGNGPPMLEQGAAYINIDARATVYMRSNHSAIVKLAVFAVNQEYRQNSTLPHVCSSDTQEPDWATNIDVGSGKSNYMGSVEITDPKVCDVGTYYLWQTQLDMLYPIAITEWHNVIIESCTPEQWGLMKIEGGVTFRNPYGFLPSELFGFLPFEGARMVAYFFIGVVYIYFIFRYQESVLPLHQGVLFVFLVALVEATCWYAAYQTINLTGEPYTYNQEFPPSVVASLILQIFRQTFARSLLLVVSLGYGIVRPKLLSLEWLAVATVSFFYFVAAIVAQVFTIVLAKDIHGDTSNSVLSYQIPELIMDVIFLSWIYMALGSTIRILTEFQQGYKLNLYNRLATVITVFVSLFVAASLLIILDKWKVIKWPWQWAWVQQVLWEVLNFSVLAAVCIICLPSDNSRRLSYASQLPTDDPDDENYEFSGYPDGMYDEEDEIGTGYLDDDFEEKNASKRDRNRNAYDDKDDLEMSSWRGGLGSHSANKTADDSHQFSSLPEATDDDNDGFNIEEEGR